MLIQYNIGTFFFDSTTHSFIFLGLIFPFISDSGLTNWPCHILVISSRLFICLTSLHAFIAFSVFFHIFLEPAGPFAPGPRVYQNNTSLRSRCSSVKFYFLPKFLALLLSSFCPQETFPSFTINPSSSSVYNTT